jgi:PAS domain S-box-containing protein
MTPSSEQTIDRFEADLVQAALESASIGFCVIDSNASMLMLNRTWLELLGFDVKAKFGDMIGAPLTAAMELLRDKYAYTPLLAAQAQQVDVLVVSGEQSRLLMLSAKSLKFRGSDEFRVLTATDVTRLKVAEMQLDLLQRQVAAINSGVVITDPTQKDNPIIFANDAFQLMTGYSRNEIIGRNCRFLQGDDRDQPEIHDMRESLAKQKSFYGVLRNYRKDGSLFLNELYMSPVFDTQGKLTNFIGVQNDITHRGSRVGT